MSVFYWSIGLLLTAVGCGVTVMYYSPSITEDLKFKAITTIVQGYQIGNEMIENVKDFTNKTLYDVGLLNPLIINFQG